MIAIIRREIKNYFKRPLFWIGVLLVIYGVFSDTSPYLHTRYLAEGEKIANDKPAISDEGEVYEGYIPADPKKHRELWHEQLKQALLEDGETDAEVQKVIGKIENMELEEAYDYLNEKYEWYGARYLYEDTSYFKGTAEEINSYLDQKMEKKPFSYYYARKFADFTGLYMGFFATIMFSVLFLQDTKRHTYELLHTKPISAGKYVLGKVSAGFLTCTFVLAVLNLLFWILCILYTRDSGFEIHLSNFIISTVLYILPNMLMIVSVYALIALIFKNPLPGVPLLILYMVYSNMGGRNAEGVYRYVGRPFAIMVRFPGQFFDTAPPPMALLNQSFLILASVAIILITMQIWKRRRMVYAFAFVVILSLIRGVVFTNEIGLSIEGPFAILIAVFCADTYVQEITSNRSEVQRLYQIKKRIYSIIQRLMIQGTFLLLLAVLGYGLFFAFQKPVTHPVTESEIFQFIAYFGAIVVTIFFWGILANTLSMLFRNMWMGIGSCLLIWVATNSSGADKFLGAWNVFSYSFRDIENATDITWLYGKGLCICIGLILLLALPKIVRKRG